MHRENDIKIIECPRDAMQGWPHHIATEKKIAYINALLKAGFHTLDFGSFVSPAAIPQLADTKNVIPHLDLSGTSTKLLAIIANQRGAEEAVGFDEISYLGFPFSVSETFQMRNTNSSIDESLKRVEAIQDLCSKNNKELVVYISMGFGNPYGDVYNADLVIKRAKQISELGVNIISVADTVGIAQPNEIKELMSALIPELNKTEIGVHLHAAPQGRKEKTIAALDAGCRRFDSAVKGIGGCPMAGNELVGNMDTEAMISDIESTGLKINVNHQQLTLCSNMADEIFV